MQWEDKKKEMLVFLRKQSDKENWFSLSDHILRKKFVDKEYNANKIYKILEELKKENEISVNHLDFDIYLPKEHEKISSEKLKPFLSTPKPVFILIGIIIMIIIFSFPSFVGLFFNDAGAVNISSFLFGGFFGGIIIILLVAGILQFFYNLFFKIFPTLKEYKEVIVPCSIISLVALVIIGLFCLFTSSPLTPALLLGIITIGIVGGIAFYAARIKIKSRRKKEASIRV